jgi:predicted nuclease of restriction endonuclease-like (RecB) superfamily
MKTEQQFTEIISLIRNARNDVYRAVNTHLINLYWDIGAYISHRTQSEGWGKATVKQLSAFIQLQEPGTQGFSDKNLWCMRQFYETYKDLTELLPLVRELSWSHNLAIFSRCKTKEEKEYYLLLSKKENFSLRELDRQISASLFEHTMIGNLKLSTLLRELHPQVKDSFKDTYVIEFLDLPEPHSEKTLEKAIIQNMKKFILELGKDFLFMGEEYRVQVGNTDFFIDLVFFHRGLQSIIAFELKTTQFNPGHLGQIEFYLEALDRDVKKPHENPSIGVLLCKDKDEEVVEYALSRHFSPTLVSKYTRVLPGKKLLQTKLHELYNLLKDKNENEED